jgi:hypothetical protein
MEDTRAAAAIASAKAEEELLTMFRSASFRFGLIRNRAWKLAMTPGSAILAQLKDELSSMEYTTNFGVDPQWRKEHPGATAMGFDTITKFGGRIPNMWELRALNSSLATGTPEDQWKIMEAAEEGLYQLPYTSKALPVGPNETEALKERPSYLGGNLRKTDIGIARYGSFAAIMRNDVVHQRGPIVSSDSGGWENICNKSVKPISSWFPYMQAISRCEGMYEQSPVKGHPVPGTADHQLHTLFGTTKIFGKLGGGMARLVHQMLTPGATVRPFETLFYTEAGLLGPLRVQDMKLMVASFPGVFGTKNAETLRLFCLTHKIPLAWAINRGETWSQSTKAFAEWLPYAPVLETVGPDRLLDPLSFDITNATSDHMPEMWKDMWGKADKEVTALRKSNVPPGTKDMKDWWNRLAVLGGGVQPLRRGDCQDANMCFGTHHIKDGSTDCLCKRETKAAPEIVV